MAGGRPTNYRDSIARAICIRLMLGESLNSICKRKEYPGRVTVYTWLLKHEEFANKYRQAREMQQEHYLDEIVDIADDSSEDWEEKDSGPALNRDHVSRSKLRIDTRRWIMERLAARKYGSPKPVEEDKKSESIQKVQIEVVNANQSNSDEASS